MLHRCGRTMLGLVLILTSFPHLTLANDVVVVKSTESVLYDKAVAGFRDTFQGSLTVIVMTKTGPLTNPKNLVDTIRKKNPKVILAVGLRAAKTLTIAISDIPIVFCMTMNPLQHKLKSQNSTGIEIEPRPQSQLQAFKRVVPGLKRVGIIYDPKRTSRFIQNARKASTALGISLVEQPINQRKQILEALQEIVNAADALWLIRDATVISREFFNHTLIIQAENKLPLLAYSSQFVKEGALCSFSSDYSTQGKKAAEVVQSILNGAQPSDLPIQAPAGTLTINLNSASRLNLKVPTKLLQDPTVNALK